ncbi:MAG: hypothetical protein J6W03_03640 [Bacteroidaceae bacterium]|nr:hypothetical protein [Bacteroidaceae bacterium]
MKRLFFIFLMFPLMLSSKVVGDTRLVIITIDGLRWQEVFMGIDESLMANTKEVRDVDQLRRMYWRHTPVDRRKSLMPFVWNTIATQGTLIGNRTLGSVMQVANKTNISFPGYSEMMTGFVDDAITSNDPVANPHRNVLEAANEDLRYKGNVVMYGSWKSTRYAIHNEEAHIPASVSYEKNIAKSQTSVLEMVDKMLAGMPRYWRSEHFDAFTYAYALETIKADHPKVIWISFGDCDEWAHARKYDLYLDAANATDTFIQDIYETCEADKFYKGKTTYLITCDHGRGDGAEWGSHGSSIKGSEATWLMLLGKGIEPKGETLNNGPFLTKQVAATIAHILDIEFTPDDGAPLQPIGM